MAHQHFPRYPRKPHRCGQARIRMRGRDYYLGPWGSEDSRREYKRLMDELAAIYRDERAAAKLPEPPPLTARLTVTQVLARWLCHARTFYPRTSREPTHFAHLVKIMDRLCGEMYAKDFDCAALRELRTKVMRGAWLTQEEADAYVRRGQPIGWCRRVANRMAVRVRTIWRWAESEGLVPHSAWEHLRALPPVPKHDASARNTPRRRPARWEQVKAVLDKVPPAVAAMLEIQWWTGMRPSELVRMKAADIVREDGAAVWLYRLKGGKNAWRDDHTEEEFVVLGPECQRVLTPWLAAAKNRGDGAFLWATSRNRRSKHYTTAAYGRAIARACEAEKIEHFTPYQLRHAAKERIKRVAGLDAARAVLRQKSIQTTDGYGDARDLELAAQVAKRVG